jgi:uncharacterized repeat protein (TIGR01451 family)
VITYQVTVDITTSPGTVISNQASLTATGPLSAISDDPGMIDGVETGNDPLDPGDDDPTLTVPVSLSDVLELAIVADKTAVTRGDFVLYTVTITNPAGPDVPGTEIVLTPPAGVVLVPGSITLDTGLGATPQPDPAPATQPIVPVGAVNTGDTFVLVYRAIVNTGAMLGLLEYEVRAFDSTPQPASFPVSNEIVLIEDPEFDLGTIIGKVFDDKDGNGVQGAGEKGIGGVMVAMEDGVYAITDVDGLYHIAAIRPGNRLVKINKHTLPPYKRLTLPEAQTVTMTPGLLTKVNFGADLKPPTTVRQGRPGTYGIAVSDESASAEAEVIGNLDAMTAVVNGVKARLPRARAKMDVMSLERNLRVVNGRLEKPAIFNLSYPTDRKVREWAFEIFDANMRRIRGFRGSDLSTKRIVWNGKDANGRIVKGGAVYQYQFTLEFADGSLSKSPLRLFGVNRTNVISFELTGASFDTNKATLKASARRVLDEVVRTLKKHPDERVVVRGHTDSTGDWEWNRELSLRRANSVRSYLIAAGISPDQLIAEGRGASSPVATNATAAGRARNRRVEIKALLEDTDRARVHATSREGGERQVVVNGKLVPADEDGSFRTVVDPIKDRGRVYVGIRSEDGGVAATTVKLPTIRIVQPTTDVKVPIGGRDSLIKMMQPRQNNGQLIYPTVKIPVRGRTEPGNLVFIDGEAVEVDGKGVFDTRLPLAVGENIFGVVAISPRGFTSLVNLSVNLSGLDKNRNLVTVRKPVPRFSIELPARGAVLSSPNLFVRGTAPSRATVAINRWRIPVLGNGTFAATIRLPEGPSVLDVVVSMPDGSEARVGVPVSVKSDYFFMVALGDATVNKVSTDGPVPEEFEDDLYVDGRVAFYLKGRVQGKYLITAGLDTGDGRIEDIGDRLDDRDNSNFFRNLDPDKFYPVYGDGSRTIKDTNSQGRFYVLFEAPTYTAQWGNFNSEITGTEFSSFNRSLYGGKATWASLRKGKDGEPMGRAVVFGALPETRSAHDEFAGTGGSLYFLRNKNVALGSEKVRLEVRDQITGIPIANVTRRNYVDYEIDYAEGRILFRTPVTSVADSSTIISDDLLNGNPVFIVVDYEFTDLSSTSLDDSTYGARVKQTVGEKVTLGATYVKEDRAASTYNLQGGDVTLRLGESSEVMLEYSRSENEVLPEFFSPDGGLSFVPKPVPATSDPSEAYRFEFVTGGGPVRATGYFRHIDDGFSSSFTTGVNETDQLGATLALAIGRNAQVKILLDELETANVSTVQTGTLQYLQKMGRVDMTIEGRYRDTDNELLPDTTEGIGAIRFDFNATPKLKFFARYQEDFLQEVGGIAATEGLKQQTTVGLDAKLSPKVTARAEYTTAEVGDSALVGLTTKVDEKTILYGTYSMSPDQGGAVTGILTLGAKTGLGERSRLYTEEQFKRREGEITTTNVVGLNTRLSDRLTSDLSFERTKVDGSGATPDTIRQAASASLSFAAPRFKLYTKLELREDEGTGLERDQWVTSNAVELKLSRDFTLLGRYNYGVTEDVTLGQDESVYDERSVGFAFRPVAYDWINFMGRYTKVSNLPPSSQVAVQDETTDEIFSFQTVVDLHRRLTLTEKFAVRDRVLSPALLADLQSQLKLWINRFDYHLSDKWDAALEYRTLSMDEGGDNESDGFLLEVNRLFLNHLRLGVGYNFTDFTDNEFSANDYSAKGFFFRIQGKY